MTDSIKTDSPSGLKAPDDYAVGYKKPPKLGQFRKGQSGNPKGRPKAPAGISIKDILDGDQIGKNGEIVSGREAFVIRILNDAFAGKQKAFRTFLKLLRRSGLRRIEPSSQVANIYFDVRRMMTPEEREIFTRNFGLPRDQWT